jgi:SAM-dependent methyltransferase
MTSTTTVRPLEPQPWFASWFDSIHYHRLYAHRDDAEAAALIDRLIDALRPAPGARVADLGCGAGRHARRLAALDLRVIGLDLAASSLAEARRFEQPGLRFFRHDMRQPFGRAAFDYAFSFFTSFGYFDRPEEHHAVVRNIAAALAPGGKLVLDYLNAAHADAGLVREEERSIDGAVYRIARWSDADAFFKRIDIVGPGGPVVHEERVARFGLDDFTRLFDAHGLRIERVFGDYQLNDYDAVRSPRLILLAGKPGPRSLATPPRPVRAVGARLLRAVPPHPAERLGRDAEI